MFNNVLYFIIVLLIFNISSPGSRPESSLPYTLSMVLLTWLILALYCRRQFHSLLARWRTQGARDGRLVGEYHGLILRFSILSILLFALDVHLFQLRYWLQSIPGFKTFSVLQGSAALSLFLGYLGTVWYFACPVFRALFGMDFTPRAFVVSNVKFNIPIVFPWVILTLVVDLASLIPSRSMSHLLNSPEGQIVFFAGFLAILMVLMPPLIQTWWGCKPFPDSGKIRELETFLREKSFGYRRLLRWPLLEGRGLTAGIMGIVARFRYILVTDGLMEVLSVGELKAVLAHEMGHAKYKHMLYYLLFLLGYMVVSFGIFDVSFSLLALEPFFMKILESGESKASDLFYLLLSLPILATMVLYFRYVMGFFMRHFERQADLFSAVTMGTPRDTINSLEKIAFLGGRIRDLPSWHHFSIRQRVEFLLRTISDPILAKKHSRFVKLALFFYLICMCGLSYLLLFSSVKEDFTLDLVGKVIHEQIEERPYDLDLYQNLAMVYQKMGRIKDAVDVYEKMLRLDGERPLVLNNLAWLLVTASDPALRDNARGLELAKEAVSLKRSPVFLDTLAEAYFANGLTDEAVETIREAIASATEGVDYYRSQQKKFMKGPGAGRSHQVR